MYWINKTIPSPVYRVCHILLRLCAQHIRLGPHWTFNTRNQSTIKLYDGIGKRLANCLIIYFSDCQIRLMNLYYFPINSFYFWENYKFQKLTVFGVNCRCIRPTPPPLISTHFNRIKIHLTSETPVLYTWPPRPSHPPIRHSHVAAMQGLKPSGFRVSFICPTKMYFIDTNSNAKALALMSACIYKFYGLAVTTLLRIYSVWIIGCDDLLAKTT